MTIVTLELPLDLAGNLTRQASQIGMTLDEFLLQLVRQTGTAPAARPLQVPRFDPYLAKAGQNARSAAREAELRGIADAEGSLLIEGLPEDMKEDAERDFGG